MKNKCKIKFTIWALLFTILIPFSVHGMDGQIEITQMPSTIFPIIIYQPGDYILTTNIVVSDPNVYGIQINADDVTLDLNGHTITGPGEVNGPKSIGIYASDKNNIAVMNGTVEKFFQGLNLCCAYHLVKEINADHNVSDGIIIDSSTLANCTANNNGSNGIRATSSTITGCITNFNGNHGSEINSSSITNCTANINGVHGIYAINMNKIEENCLQKNGGYGLYLDPNNNYAVKNCAGNNADGAFYSQGDNNYLPTSGDDANYEF